MNQRSCPVNSAITNHPCLLPEGHMPWSAERFHKYEKPEVPLDPKPAKNVDRPGLRLGRHLSIQERFEEWLVTPDGKLVFTELTERAAALKNRGWKHYSHKAIIETIRYDRNINVGPENGFKINDHYSSRLARLAMSESPFLKGFFEVRELKA